MIPILFETRTFSVQTLWIFVGIALITGSYLGVKRLKRSRVNFNIFIEHSTGMILSALFISRLLYFATNTQRYFPRFDLRTFINFISIWDQGFSLWGAVLGMSIPLYYQIRKQDESLSKWTDALSVPFLVAFAIGSFGAFLGGYAYGNPTNLPWGVVYEIANVKYTVAIHPVQIYTIIGIAGILGFKKIGMNKYAEFEKFVKKPGSSTLYYATSFSFIYFILEFFRGDDTLQVLNIRLSMLASLVVGLAGLTLIYKRLKLSNESSQTPQS